MKKEDILGWSWFAILIGMPFIFYQLNYFYNANIEGHLEYRVIYPSMVFSWIIIVFYKNKSPFTRVLLYIPTLLVLIVILFIFQLIFNIFDIGVAKQETFYFKEIDIFFQEVLKFLK